MHLNLTRIKLSDSSSYLSEASVRKKVSHKNRAKVTLAQRDHKEDMKAESERGSVLISSLPV